MPYHSYYESYSADDYLADNDYKKNVKFEIDGYYTFSKSYE